MNLRRSFVANRVAEITTLLPAINLPHEDRNHNPADLISRGALPDQIINSALWWYGRSWSSLTQETWSSNSIFNVTQQRQVEREQRSSAGAYIAVYENLFLDGMLARYYYPNLQILLRVTARMLRFCYRELRTTNRLAPQKIDNAMQVYVRHVQNQHYRKEINQLELVENRLLRLGGRLQLSTFFDYPWNECCTEDLSSLRWMCSCEIYTASADGQLPADRLKPNPLFSITGIHYAGPIDELVAPILAKVTSSCSFVFWPEQYHLKQCPISALLHSWLPSPGSVADMDFRERFTLTMLQTYEEQPENAVNYTNKSSQPNRTTK